MSSAHDVFLSFKNLDEHGGRTEDSLLAEKLYHHLSDHGLRVFFSDASLEKLGAADYSRTIDEILDHVDVLVAVGTSTANLESRWVRYEWDSFSNDILSGKKPHGRVFVYTKGLKIGDLPRKLRHTQCISDGPGSFERLTRFIENALGRRPEETDATTEAPGESPDDRGPDANRSVGRRWFGVAALGRIAEGQQREWSAFHGRRAASVPDPIDWTAFCAELGARVARAGYSAYGTRAASVGQAYYRGACEAFGDEDAALAACHLMSDLPVNARQRRLVRSSFLKGVHVGVVVGGTIGTREECELLRSNGGFLLPIGASGGTAFTLWSRLVEEYGLHLSKDLLGAFEGLGDPANTPYAHLNAVMRIVDARFSQGDSIARL